jgi:hypothetical protein
MNTFVTLAIAFNCLRFIDLPPVTNVALVSRFISNKKMGDNKTKEAQEVSCLLIGVASQGKQNMNGGDKPKKRRTKNTRETREGMGVTHVW